MNNPSPHDSQGEEKCEGCRGEPTGLVECCNGDDGCPCKGQPSIPWTCRMCNGTGKKADAPKPDSRRDGLGNKTWEQVFSEFEDEANEWCKMYRENAHKYIASLETENALPVSKLKDAEEALERCRKEAATRGWSMIEKVSEHALASLRSSPTK